MDAFEFHAPQFVERLDTKVSIMENDGADEYFDIPEFNSYTDSNEKSVPSTPKLNVELKEKFFTPLVHPTISPSNVLSDITNSNGKGSFKTPGKYPKGERPIMKAKRRVSNLNKEAETEGLKKEENKLVSTFEGIQLNSIPPEKQHSMVTRHDVFKSPKIELRNRVVDRETLKRKGSPIKYGGKYQTLAEKVFHFQNDTPPRFKSKSIRPSTAPVERTKLTLTMAHSPKLATKLRTRAPPVPSQVENTLVKANPVNKNIFRPPVLNKPPPRPSTIPVPFKLTEVKPKESNKTLTEPFKFKARPTPRQTRAMNTSTVSSLLTQSDNNEKMDSSIYKGLKTVTGGLQSTKIKPFSFDERNKTKQLEKEEKIRKILDEQTKIPKFTAQPPPSKTRFAASSKTVKSAPKAQ
ncbi:targeting protein for Xklp2-A-like [Cimex lectularius]|uniref:TPX2 central domain-containing protein n=1 Tax=Cimex lectularius TaxID=79782 RepID=A0A8I6TDB6_CIMLE|nr:targeting protein for Xklp2-A-like [Cimex lectularius]XP_014246020.1 targeting protein for Xklp2-A-like [Cimex lectularius]